MILRRRAVVLLGLAAATLLGASARAIDWGDAAGPSAGVIGAIGGHARGCLDGARALPLDGAGYQVMRPSRNRYYGHPQLIAFIEAFAAQVRSAGWSVLLVGDLAQPRGGPMSSGHRSHQTGLDVDIWFRAAPASRLSLDEREVFAPVSMVEEGGDAIDVRTWTDGHAALLRAAAQFEAVDRIFVNPAIKRHLCRTETGERQWLGKIRPWWGHDQHFHVGLRCPAGAAECVDREPAVPPGDGCDASLDWWFSEEARAELRQSQAAPPRRLTLDDLPAACRSVLFSE